MPETLKLEIVTPEGPVYSEDVEMVTLPGVVGEMGIYPHHVPLMTQMVPGEIIVHKDGRDIFLATGEGLIDVTGSRVSVLTDLATNQGETASSVASRVPLAWAEWQSRPHRLRRVRE